MPPKTVVPASSYVFPVIGGDPKRDDVITIRAVLGTAFSIGGGVFMTAGHTIQNAHGHGAASLGSPDGGRWQGTPIQDPEVLDGYDLAVFRASPQTVNQTRWVNRELSLLDPVRTIGHPNSADVLRGRIGRMAFDGSVVTSHRADRRFPLLSKLPRIYLVSFRCPVGLSGSPLWAHPLFAVAGVIVGNIAMDLPVFQFEETLTEQGKDTRLIQQEVAYFGVAVESTEMVQIESALLGCSIGEWLTRHGLLV